MKKSIVCLAFVLCSSLSWGDTITNYVYVVSNIFNHVYTETVVTQKVKNTHYEYYFTNTFYEVTNQVLLISQTNLNVEVINTNFAPWIALCDAAALKASNSVSTVQHFSSVAASNATAAGSSASSARSYAASALDAASQAAQSANNGLANINARIQWFDDHAGQTITQINVTSNVTVSQTIISNQFDHVPYNVDPVLALDLNSFGMTAMGGTNNVYTIVAPGHPVVYYGSSGSSSSIDSFRMTFDHVDIDENRRVRLWYRSDYDTGTPNPSATTGYTWRYEWGYWSAGVWHVAIRESVYSGAVLSSTEVFEMKLAAGYPFGSGRFGNRPAHIWASSYSSYGNMTASASSDFGFVESLAIYGQAERLFASLSNRVDEVAVAAESGAAVANLASSVEVLSNALEYVSNKVETAAIAGDPVTYEHNGTSYSRIMVYPVADVNGKVKVTPTSSSYYAASEYTVTPAYRYPTTTASTWKFVPAYVDTDANGLRLQYVPTAIHAIQYSSSASTRFLVPEYLYWQNGYIYIKIKTFTSGEYDGGYAIGRCQDSNYPNNITSSKTMSKTDGNNWSSSSAGTIVGSATISPGGSPMWFPATPSPSVTPTINWMTTGQ